tara:strand:- start:206 stop:772 length:567 start_codon:yes stop_codon:yes gene_type:complete
MQAEQAAEAIGKISPGMELFGLTKGQFSFISVIETVLVQIGPADVVISTWTAAGAEIETAKKFLENDKIKSLRFLVDQSFRTRQPEYCNALIRTFGQDCVRMSRSHCKFAVIKNRRWNIVIRTSMNLNENPRIENFEISDDKAFAKFFLDLIDEIFDKPFAYTEEDFSSLGQKNQNAPDPLAALDGWQ